jgi:hypothetical protein
MSATVRGLDARRSSRAHAARISAFHGISGFARCASARTPHRDIRGEGFLEVHSLGAYSKRIRVAIEHDERGGA